MQNLGRKFHGGEAEPLSHKAYFYIYNYLFIISNKLYLNDLPVGFHETKITEIWSITSELVIINQNLGFSYFLNVEMLILLIK